MPLSLYTDGQVPVAQKVQYPFAPMSQRSVAYAATIAETIDNSTILNFATLTADATLNLTIAQGLPVGTVLYIKVPAQTNGFALTFGTGIDAPDLVGVAGKTKIQSFYFDGTVFLPQCAGYQID